MGIIFRVLCLNRVYNFTCSCLKQGYLPKIMREQFPVNRLVFMCCSSMEGNVCME